MKLFAIFGNPVDHSRSPLMHNYTFEKLGIRHCYTRVLLESANVKETFLNLRLSGANITVPHKEEAFLQADEIRGIAKEIGAVNTLIYEDKKIIGYNTDAPGFMKAVEVFDFKSALILGAGGTAKAISAAFAKEGIDFAVLNRSAGRLDYFEKRGWKVYTWENFEPDSYKLIVNTTSAGLKDDSFPAPENILKKVFENAKYAVDAIYGKKTPFLKLAESLGLETKDGKDMLLYQGVLAFDYFTNHRYDIKTIEKFMRESFEL
ncbi:shikimate dehydrogenase [Nitrosophilus alvini]|uniref:shikimate dehydrogenase n=1 Tax=Nitrosophilus alvini TaxID=2714855 RepID=UPI00190AB694|nr:shikimate dehydrogenase [Nitrosophilus alvini]